jgi:hypothetical protein
MVMVFFAMLISPSQQSPRNKPRSKSRNALRRNGPDAATTAQKLVQNQLIMSKFPTHENREFFAPLQGIKSVDQGNFSTVREIQDLARFGSGARWLRRTTWVNTTG